jgi:hypothetical protein
MGSWDVPISLMKSALAKSKRYDTNIPSARDSKIIPKRKKELLDFAINAYSE